uniref:ATP synthase subunit a n=1 Tax=Porcellio dilatatus dilatatus TaxID=96810 RepID=A0A1P8DKG6_PORDI|nr:ATP synthase subunit 6 [Porcellio dilatatus dilatatus]
MMTNLFSVFDPASGLGLSLNWVALSLGLLVYPLAKWSVSSRAMEFTATIYSLLYKEVGPLLSSKGKILALIFTSMFFFIFWMNLMGLIPYIFTPTSHLAVTLSLALPLWLSYFTYGWVKNLSWMLAHLMPQGTPLVLMPFMVIIESVSSMIRPFTLAVRLMANMIAGHLLLTLISGSVQVLVVSSLVCISVFQILLVVLEVAVAAIQAYVLVVLSVLYASEV